MTINHTVAPWFVPLVDDPDRPVRVFGMPQAGAGCATFADCAARLSSDVALYGLNLPGRQARFGEPARTDLGLLATDLANDLRGYLDRPYVLVGYCSGAALAYLVAREVHAAGLPLPRALVAISFPGPQFTAMDQDVHVLPSGEFWQKITDSGGFPPQLAAQPEFRDIFEPALRADYELFAGFRYEESARMPLDISVIIGRHDPALQNPIDLVGWSAQTSGTCSVHIVESDHWLLDGAPNIVARIVEDACRIATN
ncbi:thioesterase II family protein [Catellatospora chokoriensis]|uniref:Thioesterase n=1 Tax=Catellatospora chokoriensis TaxID=310353 RepID=A0A8J3JMG0_9ACTN|nr:alpha/beta fold hydrolase [Catellatospora chokoriensis]GIF87681.1 thioesterase [Catellatospora chokoriensis]